MIPIHKHYYRSQKIEYNLFPKNRKFPFTRKLFKKEYIRLLGVFMFWIYLVFAGVFFHVFLALYRETPYNGLKVNLPKAKHSKRLQSGIRDLFIFIDRDTKIVVNDKSMKSYNELYSFFEQHKMVYENFSVILFIDVSVKMGAVKNVLEALRFSNLLEIHFRTR